MLTDPTHGHRFATVDQNATLEAVERGRTARSARRQSSAGARALLAYVLVVVLLLLAVAATAERPAIAEPDNIHPIAAPTPELVSIATAESPDRRKVDESMNGTPHPATRR
jgi:hypothetical protein